MDKESVERLRFDRRLARRRGWVEESEVQKTFDALPDVGHKMTTAAELEAEEKVAAEQAAETIVVEEPPAEIPAPAPVAGDFGAPTNLGGGGFGRDSGGGSSFS